jgi:putative heme-binding domain-containing protein
VIESGLALARFGGKENQTALLTLLNALNFAKLADAQQIALVRVYQVVVSRNGLPESDALAQTVARLDAVFPAKTNDLNRELSRTLAALGSSEVVAKTITLMRSAKDDPVSWLSVERMARNDHYGPNFLRSGEARPNQQQIAYAYGIRFTKEGWTPELRREFFTWFASTGPWLGGNQFRGFIDTIRTDALASMPDVSERTKLAILATPKIQNAVPAVIHSPKGPGKNYSVDEVVTFAKNLQRGRNFERGHELFIAAACQACHRLGAEGGGVGPDLTGAGNRYTLRDLMENIVDPSKVISDQYESSVIALKNGGTVVGRITGEEGGILQVATNPAAPGQITEVRNTDVQSRKVSPVSLMPPGLINSMNQEEVADLIAYILSGGDRRNKMFKK